MSKWLLKFQGSGAELVPYRRVTVAVGFMGFFEGASRSPNFQETRPFVEGRYKLGQGSGLRIPA